MSDIIQESQRGFISSILSNDQKNIFNKHGYIIIDNFLPPDLYKELKLELKAEPSNSTYQIRTEHYSHVFSSEKDTLPKSNESYIAKFSLIETNGLKNLKKAFLDHIAPILKEVSNNKAKHSLFPAAVRLRAGDVYRTHQDAYAGIVGFSFFINDGWCWDYGGILTYVREEYKAEAIFPKSNRLLLRNETFKHFHFLNSIEQYCTKEQFLLLGWADSSFKEDHKSLGKYQEI